MITTYKEPYKKNDELRIGWASWDSGSLTDRSIKYAYRDSSGKISRGSPELPFTVLVDMLMLAAKQGELSSVFSESRAKEAKNVSELLQDELVAERKELATTLVILQKLQNSLPWADIQPAYNEIKERHDKIKQALDLMTL